LGRGAKFQLPRRAIRTYLFTLKDEKAQVKCVAPQPGDALKVPAEDGLKLIVRGSISVYEPRGEYQIYVEHIEPSGVGALQFRIRAAEETPRGEGFLT